MNINNQSSIPNIKKFPSNKVVLFTSLCSIIIPSTLAILGLNNIDTMIKIIICLAFTCVVLLVDVCFYFVKEREYYYAVCYMQNTIKLLESNIKTVESKISN